MAETTCSMSMAQAHPKSVWGVPESERLKYQESEGLTAHDKNPASWSMCYAAILFKVLVNRSCRISTISCISMFQVSGLYRTLQRVLLLSKAIVECRPF